MKSRRININGKFIPRSPLRIFSCLGCEEYKFEIEIATEKDLDVSFVCLTGSHVTTIELEREKAPPTILNQRNNG